MEIEERNYFGVKCDLVLDDRRADKKGMKRVYVRLYHDRHYKRINTGLKAVDWKQCSTDEQTKVIQIYDNIWKRVVDLVGRDCFNLDNITDAKVSTTLNDFMQDKINELMKNNQVSTAYHYRSALNLIDEKLGKLPIKSMTADHFTALKQYMTDKGYSPTTMQIYLTDIKAVVNWLRHKKLIREEDYPFRKCIYDTDKVAIPKGVKRTECWLEKETIRGIWDRWKESHDRWLGMWLFSYLAGGINIADMLDLRFDSHWKKTKQTELKYKRKKTAKKNDFWIVIPVTDKLREIIESTGIRDGERIWTDLDGVVTAEDIRNKIMCVNNKVSKIVGKVCRSLGVTEKVTSTWARHSFATVMSRERVPYNYIEYAMGHANNEVSSHYIAGWSTEEMKEFSSMLL